MHKYLFLIPATLFLLSCGSEQSSESSKSAEKSLKTGKEIYMTTCAACHQQTGKGMTGTFPPLAQSDYLLEDTDRAIRQIIHGSQGKMTVNGIDYHGIMPPQNLSNEEVMRVLNYVLTSWGNQGDSVTIEQVKAQR